MQARWGVGLALTAVLAACASAPDEGDTSSVGRDEAEATATTVQFTGKYKASYVRDDVTRSSESAYDVPLSITFYEDATRETAGGDRMYDYLVQEGPRQAGDTRHLTLGFVKRNNVPAVNVPAEVRANYKTTNMLRLAMPSASGSRASEWYLVRGTAIGAWGRDYCSPDTPVEECQRMNPWPCVGETGISVQCGSLEIAGPVAWKGASACPEGTREFKPVYTAAVCLPDDPWATYRDSWPRHYHFESTSYTQDYQWLACGSENLHEDCRGDDLDQTKGISRGDLTCFEGDRCDTPEMRKMGLVVDWASDANVDKRAASKTDFRTRRTASTKPRGPAKRKALAISDEAPLTDAVICGFVAPNDVNEACE